MSDYSQLLQKIYNSKEDDNKIHLSSYQRLKLECKSEMQEQQKLTNQNFKRFGFGSTHIKQFLSKLNFSISHWSYQLHQKISFPLVQ